MRGETRYLPPCSLHHIVSPSTSAACVSSLYTGEESMVCVRERVRSGKWSIHPTREIKTGQTSYNQKHFLDSYAVQMQACVQRTNICHQGTIQNKPAWIDVIKLACHSQYTQSTTKYEHVSRSWAINNEKLHNLSPCIVKMIVTDG